MDLESANSGGESTGSGQRANTGRASHLDRQYSIDDICLRKKTKKCDLTCAETTKLLSHHNHLCLANANSSSTPNLTDTPLFAPSSVGNNNGNSTTGNSGCSNNLNSSTVATTSGTTGQNQTNQKKEKQRPETWNKIEQQIFFNALRQNGKNFESITQYFNARQKRYKIDEGTPCMQRSKEQIRHFYYRTWHKIIKYINIPKLSKDSNENNTNNNNNNTNNKTDDASDNYSVDMSNCSLRDMQVKCLIAFNALMNKSYRWNKKTAIKLVELVNNGCTAVREKGKITRLRMPIVKMSSKPLQKIELDPSNVLPQIVNVRLEPNSESAYCRVHRLAQNPFLSIKLRSVQTVKFLIEFLENKWKPRKNPSIIEKLSNDNQPESNATIVKSNTTSENDESNENVSTSKRPASSVNVNESPWSLLDELILYPGEMHNLVSVDLFESSNATSGLALTTAGSGVDELPGPVPKDNSDFIGYDDPLGIDDCAMIADDVLDINNRAFESKSSDERHKNYQLTVEQLRAGLTQSNTSNTKEASSKESKELTFGHLHLAFSRPAQIVLKYDWILKANHDSRCAQTAIKSSTSVSTGGDQVMLSYGQSQQQQFYIDVLASVAASFLHDIQKSKTESSTASNTPVNSSNTHHQQQHQHSKSSSSTSTTPTASQPTHVNSSPGQKPQEQFKVPQKPATAYYPTQLDIDAVLQRISEDQTNKTKKLLSDLSSKRRSRQRKPIMVVNTGHPPRNMLPKLNMMTNQQLLSSLNPTEMGATGETNETPLVPQQQNIVYSAGPVAAVARQIVAANGNPTVVKLPQYQTLKLTPDQSSSSSSSSSSKLHTISTIQQTYSNLIPQILNTLMMEKCSSHDDQLPRSSSPSSGSSNNQPALDADAHKSANMNEMSIGELTDMSLLECSINNTDSLFNKLNKSQPSAMQTNRDDIDTHAKLANSKSGKFQNDKEFSINLSENSLSNLLNSIEAHNKESSQDLNAAQSNQFCGHTFTSNNTANTTNNNTSANGASRGFGAEKRSDIIVEWTDSMNDISLSGCFLNELQSPEKIPKSSIVLNESSRDSIFLNMDTIMDIIPSVVVNRFDDSSLLNNPNTIENIQGASGT